MRILLVRHAHAGVRGTWPGDDLDRELSDRGRREAREVLTRWAGEPIAAVHSSRAVRCVETVRPLAEKLGLAVRESPQLLEGAMPGAALSWLESLPGEVAVACTHGDVIGGVMQRLVERGTRLDGDLDWPKGSTWELEVDGGLVVHGALHLPSEE